MSKKCIICNKEFESKRADAEVCSPTCRQKHWRNKKNGVYSLEKSEYVEKPSVVDAKADWIPPHPKKEDYQDSFDYAEAKNDWKRKYNL